MAHCPNSQFQQAIFPLGSRVIMIIFEIRQHEQLTCYLTTIYIPTSLNDHLKAVSWNSSALQTPFPIEAPLLPLPLKRQQREVASCNRPSDERYRHWTHTERSAVNSLIEIRKWAICTSLVQPIPIGINEQSPHFGRASHRCPKRLIGFRVAVSAIDRDTEDLTNSWIPP